MRITTSNYNNSNQNFQGFKIKNKKLYNQEFQRRIFSSLNISLEDVVELSKNVSKKRQNFYDFLAKNYNITNFYKKPEQKEDIKFVNEIYNSIKKPKDTHFYLIEKMSDSFETLNNIFTSIGNDRKNLAFAKNVYDNIFLKNINAPKEIILDLLSSPMRSKYQKDFSKYKSYIELNINDKNCIANLDKMVQENSFDSAHYDMVLNIRNFFDGMINNETEDFNAKKLYTNYSKENIEFLEKLTNIITLQPKLSTNKGNYKQELLKIYNSLNKKNYNLRNNLLDFASKKLFLYKTEQNEIIQLRKIYENADNNKHATKFLEKLCKNSNNSIKSLKGINDLLENIPNAKLNIFFDNVNSIISRNKIDNWVDVVKTHIENPFYIRDLALEHKPANENIKDIYQETITSKLFKKVKNFVNQQRYKIIEKPNK